MDLVAYTQLVNEARDPAATFPTADEILEALKRHLGRREHIDDLLGLRQRLLASSRWLLRNTIRLNNIAEQPDFDLVMARLTGMRKLKGYWASKLMSVPLLRSAIDQLNTARTGPAMAMAIARLVGVVENTEDEIPAPTKTLLDNGGNNYHSIYQYLTKIDGWNEERVAEFDGAMRVLRDGLIKQAAVRIAKGKPTSLPRPAGW